MRGPTTLREQSGKKRRRPAAVEMTVRGDGGSGSGEVAGPVVEGFVLPEVMAGTVENGVGVAGCYSLEAVRDARDWDPWRD